MLAPRLCCLALVALAACETGPLGGLSVSPSPSARAASSADWGQPAEVVVEKAKVVVETVEVPGDLPAFVLRGARGQARMVFLHGMCGHGLGYVQSFQFAAAERGSVIGLQGDVSCGGPWRAWSGDIPRLHARINEAFRAAGLELRPGEEVVAMGYSMGASRAEDLARKYPSIYTRVVLMGAPSTPSAARLKSLKGAVMMAGERDRQDHMRAAARALSALGVQATYIPLPGAMHGSMGASPGDGERVMEKAFAFFWPEPPPALER